jgi:hypothetical protein
MAWESGAALLVRRITLSARPAADAGRATAKKRAIASKALADLIESKGRESAVYFELSIR